ncbi:Ubiquitin family protein [Tritrichomonas foetus]|uniref:UV excision repair protein RAD23 n=1 Tax=Tritrichomonas foetus TaxID=1144522 RepID=A0A1J4L1Z4_9EUKA|nr:Ubiquitin family protein [Tritrichomonas foetus]|eukprot:OHT15909.1 Ubiquitin family protein [Tritrichomonas foetus]
MVSIHFKTIAGQQYTIEADPTATISELKKILAQQNGFNESTITFAFKSKVLEESATIAEIEYTEDLFIVLFIRKNIPKKTAVIPKSKNANNEKSTEASKEESSIKNKDPTIHNTPLRIEPAQQIHTSPLKIFQPNTENDPPDFNEKVETLKAMGYDQPECESALRASLYQVELAAEYLVSGNIPEIPQPLNLNEALLDSDYSEEEDENSRFIAEMLTIKNVLDSHPENFAEYIQMLDNSNPELVREIKKDPIMFLHRLGLDPSKFDVSSVKKPASQYEEMMAQFNNEEKQAIHRLEENGFDTMTVIQVFIACDKNEELTNSCLASMRN